MKLRTLLLFSIAMMSQAQTPTRSVTITWTDTINPATGTTYSVFRASGSCSGSPTFVRLTSGLTAKTYVDSPVTPGLYCYTATATLNGMESDQAVGVTAQVKPFPPSSVTGTVQ